MWKIHTFGVRSVVRVETDHRTVPENSCLPNSQITIFMAWESTTTLPIVAHSGKGVVAKCGLTKLVHQYPSSFSLGLDNSEACAVSRMHPVSRITLLTTYDYTFGFSISLLLLSKQAIHFQVFST